MASRGQRSRFEDFYGSLEDEWRNSDSSRGHHSDQREATSAGEGQGCPLREAKGDTVSASGSNTAPDESQRRAPRPVKRLSVAYDPWRRESVLRGEYEGGAGFRIYRRAQDVAERMTIETCTDGDKVKRREQDVMSKPCTVCHWCGTVSPDPLKRFVRCLAVSYCNRQCQRQDFKNHKIYCRQFARLDTARARVYPAVRFFHGLRHAKDYTVLLDDMPSEQQHKAGATCNVLVELMGQIFHPYRYSCLVTFGDGVPGIRINDLDSVYIIDMGDLDMSKGYTKSMEQIVRPASTFSDNVCVKGIYRA
ncbi:hypothetical protein RRG08_065723 [Elysia crispata]|uniref:MYND-type domain-containing protein n=1 Tax=Elysia crispata TaxID=231223 RepID=A0AAE0Z6F9_9GAST|nr:hypothetical protein RRG08_065723 [Elysia crispata]